MGSERGDRDGGAPMPLRQDLSADADAAALAVYFLRELEVRVDALDRAWMMGTIDVVHDIARHLRGAGGGYGFPEITREAAELERAILADEAVAAEIGEKLEDLIDTCRQACAGGGGRP